MWLPLLKWNISMTVALILCGLYIIHAGMSRVVYVLRNKQKSTCPVIFLCTLCWFNNRAWWFACTYCCVSGEVVFGVLCVVTRVRVTAKYQLESWVSVVDVLANDHHTHALWSRACRFDSCHKNRPYIHHSVYGETLKVYHPPVLDDLIPLEHWLEYIMK